MVLVVDDDMTLRFLARESLEQAGFTVEEAEDGALVLAAFARLQPDIVLLDIDMPQVDGFTVCATLRHMPSGEHTPVLMMTGLDDVESINRAYEVGATDFITKPINWLILSHRVRYMLRASQTLADLRISETRLAKAQSVASFGKLGSRPPYASNALVRRGLSPLWGDTTGHGCVCREVLECCPSRR